jgi:hypothetical protein
MPKRYTLKKLAGPPPIPQDAKKPAQDAQQLKLDKALLETKGDDMLQMAADLVEMVTRFKNAFKDKGSKEFTMLAKEVKGLHDRNPQVFGDAMSYLQNSIEAYTAIAKILGDEAPVFKKNMGQLYKAIDTIRSKPEGGYGALPKEQLMNQPTKRNLLQALMVKDMGLSKEEAKGRVEHMSDADIDKMLPDEKFKQLVGASVSKAIQYRGRTYQAVQ